MKGTVEMIDSLIDDCLLSVWSRRAVSSLFPLASSHLDFCQPTWTAGERRIVCRDERYGRFYRFIFILICCCSLSFPSSIPSSLRPFQWSQCRTRMGETVRWLHLKHSLFRHFIKINRLLFISKYALDHRYQLIDE